MTADPGDLPRLSFIGARILTPEGLAPRALHVARGRIADRPGKPVDLSGYTILPGIVDLHGDGFERHLAPRRGAQGDLGPGLAALDAELGANGVTTGVLAQFLSWEGGMRGPACAERLGVARREARTRTDLRMQLRLEVGMIDEYARASDIVLRHEVPYVVFNDHLPHDALARGRTPPGLTGQALRAGRSPQAHHALLQALHAGRNEVGPALAALARALAGAGVLLGSHDDKTPADRARARRLGARIAEFPETRAAALDAHGAGDAVLMGAPNVLRGGSHRKGQRAADLIAEGMVDALVSDYHYPALHRAAFKLAGDGAGLADAWALVSARPAHILGLGDRGVLRPGKRADLVIVDTATRKIEGTMSGGRFGFLCGGAAARLTAA